MQMENTNLSAFGEILIFLIGGLLFVMGGLVTAWIIRPHRPNEEKLATYESGEQPVGSAWVRFNIRFYVVALLFVLFEVEIIFLFPWATVFGQKELIEGTQGLWGWFSLVEMLLFIGILALGLAYAWVRGFLDWPKPEVNTGTEFKSPVPKAMYDQINKKYSQGHQTP